MSGPLATREAAAELGMRLVVAAAAKSMPRRVIDTVELTTPRVHRDSRRHGPTRSG